MRLLRAKLARSAECAEVTEDVKPGPAAASEWRASWPVPAVSMVALAVAFTHIYTIGVFLAPLQREFGWSRTAITVGLTIVSVVSVLLAPFLGALIDRLGSRRIAIPGLIIYCGSFALLSLTPAALAGWWAIWLVVGLGNVCIKPTVWAAAIIKRFDKKRGLAMAVALTGSGLGGMFLPYISASLIESIGWRGAFAAIGLGNLLIVLPLVLLFFDHSQSAGAAAATRPDRSQLPGLDRREAFRSSLFIRLAVANLLVTIALLALIVHLVPILTEGGLDRRTAAATAGLVGFSTIAGRLGTGFLLDRLSGPLIGLVAFGLPIIACLLLAMPHSAGVGIAVAILLGLSVGSEVDVVMYMASRYFGIRNFGILYGTLGGLTSLGTGLGPLLSSFVFDRSGNYAPLLLLLIPMFAVAALLVATLGKYPRFDAAGSAAA